MNGNCKDMAKVVIALCLTGLTAFAGIVQAEGAVNSEEQLLV